MNESGPDHLGVKVLGREALSARWRSLPRVEQAVLREDVDTVVDASLFRVRGLEPERPGA